MAVLLDTGPWVALLSRNDTHHKWSRLAQSVHCLSGTRMFLLPLLTLP